MTKIDPEAVKSLSDDIGRVIAAHPEVLGKEAAIASNLTAARAKATELYERIRDQHRPTDQYIA